jgi:uncharacterized protein YecT (DUF1311 family)
MKAIALASAILVLSAASALGQEDPPIDCKNAITQADMNSCAAMEWSEADDELNAVYKKALKSQEKLDRDNGEISKDYVGAVAALKKAQRAWIDYRDGHCDGVSFQVAGGSMQPQVINGCATQLTKARTKELQELINGMGN